MVSTAPIPTTSLYFQPALSSQVGSHASGLAAERLGAVVTDADDIGQCIRTILSTPKGSSPHRPTFGSDVHLYVDYPVNSARPHIVREVVDALRNWEPRIDVVKVRVDLVDLAQLACKVQWQYAAAASDGTFVTNLPLGATQ
jgi:phage baseplate assembly protein W